MNVAFEKAVTRQRGRRVRKPGQDPEPGPAEAMEQKAAPSTKGRARTPRNAVGTLRLPRGEPILPEGMKLVPASDGAFARWKLRGADKLAPGQRKRLDRMTSYANPGRHQESVGNRKRVDGGEVTVAEPIYDGWYPDVANALREHLDLEKCEVDRGAGFGEGYLPPGWTLQPTYGDRHTPALCLDVPESVNTHALKDMVERAGGKWKRYHMAEYGQSKRGGKAMWVPADPPGFYFVGASDVDPGQRGKRGHRGFTGHKYAATPLATVKRLRAALAKGGVKVPENPPKFEHDPSPVGTGAERLTTDWELRAPDRPRGRDMRKATYAHDPKYALVGTPGRRRWKLRAKKRPPDRVVLYRAMSQDEANAAQPNFRRSRFKYYSPDLDWVRGRVLDGEFANSRFKPDKYRVLMAFELRPGDDEHFQVQGHEWKLDRRRSQHVRMKKLWRRNLRLRPVTKSQAMNPRRGTARLVQRRVRTKRGHVQTYWVKPEGDEGRLHQGHWLTIRGHRVFQSQEQPRVVADVREPEHAHLIGTRMGAATYKRFLMNVGQQEREPARTKEEKLAADREKFDRVRKLDRLLPKIHAQIGSGLSQKDMRRARVEAAAMALMLKANLRIGNAESAKWGVAGATTLKPDNVSVVGDVVKLHFTGKSGVEWKREVRDGALAASIRECLRTAGEGDQLFRYRMKDGSLKPLRDAQIRAMMKTHGVLPKDLRTWAATVKAFHELKKRQFRGGSTPKKSELRAAIKQVCEAVAEELGHTPAMAKNSYIAPVLFEMYQQDNGRLRIRKPRFR